MKTIKRAVSLVMALALMLSVFAGITVFSAFGVPGITCTESCGGELIPKSVTITNLPKDGCLLSAPYEIEYLVTMGHAWDPIKALTICDGSKKTVVTDAIGKKGTYKGKYLVCGNTDLEFLVQTDCSTYSWKKVGFKFDLFDTNLPIITVTQIDDYINKTNGKLLAVNVFDKVDLKSFTINGKDMLESGSKTNATALWFAWSGYITVVAEDIFGRKATAWGVIQEDGTLLTTNPGSLYNPFTPCNPSYINPGYLSDPLYPYLYNPIGATVCPGYINYPTCPLEHHCDPWAPCDYCKYYYQSWLYAFNPVSYSKELTKTEWTEEKVVLTAPEAILNNPYAKSHLLYHWQKQDGPMYKDIPGETGDTLTLLNPELGGWYRVRIADVCTGQWYFSTGVQIKDLEPYVEPVEEPVEEPAEEPAEEPVEEPAEEPVVEPVVTFSEDDIEVPNVPAVVTEGDFIILVPTPADGTWTFDSRYLSGLNEGITVLTAEKAGTAVLKYQVVRDGQTYEKSFIITINAAPVVEEPVKVAEVKTLDD